MLRRKAVSKRGRKSTVRSKDFYGPIERKTDREAHDEAGVEGTIGYKTCGCMIGTKFEEPEVSKLEGEEEASLWKPLGREYTAGEERILIAK